MGRWARAGCLGLVVVVVSIGLWPGPLTAQLDPPAGPAVGLPAPQAMPTAQPRARVLMDVTLRAEPPDPSGHCLVLEPGQLAVTTQAGGEGAVQPVEFSLAGYRGHDPSAAMLFSVTRSPTSSTTALSGGLYCYTVTNLAPLPPGAGAATATTLAQEVALRITWAPAPPPEPGRAS